MSLLTAADVARELRLTPAWVLHLARVGVIGSVRFARGKRMGPGWIRTATDCGSTFTPPEAKR